MDHGPSRDIRVRTSLEGMRESLGMNLLRQVPEGKVKAVMIGEKQKKSSPGRFVVCNELDRGRLVAVFFP